MTKFRLSELHRGELVSAAFAACAVSGLFMLMSGFALDTLAIGGLLGIYVGFGAAWMRNRYMAALRERSNAADSQDWEVQINDVCVGTVRDSDFAAMRLKIFEDSSLYWAQLRNIALVFARIVDLAFVAVPVIAFWGLIVVAIVSPEVIPQTIEQLRASSPTELAKYAGLLLQGLAVFTMWSAIVHAACGHRFGFVNCFKEATSNALRRRLGVAAEGSLVLIRWVDDAPEFNDERRCIGLGK